MLNAYYRIFFVVKESKDTTNKWFDKSVKYCYSSKKLILFGKYYEFK